MTDQLPTRVEAVPTEEAADQADPPIDEGTLFDALLSVDELSDSEPLAYLGGDWSADIGDVVITVATDDTPSGGGSAGLGMCCFRATKRVTHLSGNAGSTKRTGCM